MPKDKIRFSHVEGRFIPVRHKESMIDHLNIVSTVIQKASEEGKFQIQLESTTKGM